MLLEYFGGDLHLADLVEINKNVDYLHSLKGALLEAQKLVAAAYGADHTFFLINGSTTGNMAASMSVTGPQQKIIMPRASHRSVCRERSSCLVLYLLILNQNIIRILDFHWK